MTTPLSNQIGKVLVEIGKALGKAIVAGVGLELARAATGHVKRIVGPKDDDDEDAPSQSTPKSTGKSTGKSTKKKSADVVVVDAIDAVEFARIRSENETLRAELEALRGARASEPPAS